MRKLSVTKLFLLAVSVGFAVPTMSSTLSATSVYPAVGCKYTGNVDDHCSFKLPDGRTADVFGCIKDETTSNCNAVGPVDPTPAN